jgi:uroporphyrinogen-III synthase
VRLLVTRPEPDNARTAAHLRALDHDVLLAPMLRTEPVAFELPKVALAGVVLTSANAARVVADHPARAALSRLPVFTVGGRTADAARAAGFTQVHSADGDQDDLVRLIARQHPDRSLLYLAGEDRAADLAAALRPAGIVLHTVVVYRALMASAFPPETAAALRVGVLHGVLHYSRRSSEAYLACARAAGLLAEALAPVHYCLSAEVARPLAAAGGRCAVAARPDEPALFGLLPRSPHGA